MVSFDDKSFSNFKYIKLVRVEFVWVVNLVSILKSYWIVLEDIVYGVVCRIFRIVFRRDFLNNDVELEVVFWLVVFLEDIR